MHCFKKPVCVKIASSIMPGVKMLRQNFVSASNKSPKDKRLKVLNTFFKYFSSSYGLGVMIKAIDDIL